MRGSSSSAVVTRRRTTVESSTTSTQTGVTLAPRFRVPGGPGPARNRHTLCRPFGADPEPECPLSAGRRGAPPADEHLGRPGGEQIGDHHGVDDARKQVPGAAGELTALTEPCTAWTSSICAAAAGRRRPDSSTAHDASCIARAQPPESARAALTAATRTATSDGGSAATRRTTARTCAASGPRSGAGVATRRHTASHGAASRRRESARAARPRTPTPRRRRGRPPRRLASALCTATSPRVLHVHSRTS
jgi:hypothetical protein